MNSTKYDLNYFTEWGGRTWENLVRTVIAELEKSGGLKDQELLEIGTRYGKMAVLFSRLGANVTGIDIRQESLDVAREEARKWNASTVSFIAYAGDLDIFPDESFDIAFTKSVLVVLPNLEGFLRQLSKKLRPGGRVVFLENARGNPFIHALRRFRHRKWDYRSAHYFTSDEIRIIRSIFEVDVVRATQFPPVYLLMGRKPLDRRTHAVSRPCAGMLAS